MLMDLDGYSAWERHMVARCADVERAAGVGAGDAERDARSAARAGGRAA